MSLASAFLPFVREYDFSTETPPEGLLARDSGTGKLGINVGGTIATPIYEITAASGSGLSFVEGSTPGSWDVDVVAMAFEKLAAPTTDFDANGQKVVNLGAPTTSTDAVTLQKLNDSLAAAALESDLKDPVRVRIVDPTYPLQIQDQQSVTFADADRVFLDFKTANQELSGIYVLGADGTGDGGTGRTATRASDAATDAQFTQGLFFHVFEGDSAGHKYVLKTKNVTLGTTSLEFGLYDAQNVTADGTTLSISGGVISIDAGYTGQTSITTVGTITTGTWNGSTIGTLYGGTGATTEIGALRNLAGAYSEKFATPTITGNEVLFTVSENMEAVIAVLECVTDDSANGVTAGDTLIAAALRQGVNDTDWKVVRPNDPTGTYDVLAFGVPAAS